MSQSPTTAEIEDRARATAREYFRTKGTHASSATIRTKVAEAFAALEAVLDGAEATTARRRPGADDWSAHEVVDHLLETDRASLDELWCLLAGRRPPGGPIPAGLQSRAPLTRPWPWLLRELKDVHQDLLSTLASVPEDFVTDARVALVMVVNVDAAGGRRPYEWVEDVDWKTYAIVMRLHAIDHMKQARRYLERA